MTRRVSCIPSSDAELHQAATAALEMIDDRTEPDGIARMLCDLLIDRYPLVDIHRQEALARYHDVDEVWYVYRDGREGHRRSEDPD